MLFVHTTATVEPVQPMHEHPGLIPIMAPSIDIEPTVTRRSLPSLTAAALQDLTTISTPVRHVLWRIATVVMTELSATARTRASSAFKRTTMRVVPL